MEDRIKFMLANMTGFRVALALKDDGAPTRAGVFSHAPFTSNVKLTFPQVVGARGADRDAEPLVVPLSRVSMLVASGVDFEASEWAPGPGKGFQTDTAISGRTGPISGRELAAWQPDDGGAGASLSLGSGKKSWDQFAANKQLFGVTTDYREEIYTTKVDRSGADYAERERTAARLADEIERSATNNAHVAEERNQGGMPAAASGRGEPDEETRYSAVLRPTDAAPSTAKYVPKHIRAQNELMEADPSIKQATAAVPQRATAGAAPATQPSFAAAAAIKATPEAEAPLKIPAALNRLGKKLPQGPAAAAAAVNLKAAAAANILNTVKSFREFAHTQKTAIELQKAKVLRAHKEDTISELRQFSKSFKLPKPMPEDLAELLHKDGRTASLESVGDAPVPATKPKANPIPATVDVAAAEAEWPRGTSFKRVSARPPPSADEAKAESSTTGSSSRGREATAETLPDDPTAGRFKFNVNAVEFTFRQASTGSPPAAAATPPPQIPPAASLPSSEIPAYSHASIPSEPDRSSSAGAPDSFVRTVVASLGARARASPAAAAAAAAAAPAVSANEPPGWRFGRYSFGALLEMAEQGEFPGDVDPSADFYSAPSAGMVDVNGAGLPLVVGGPQPLVYDGAAAGMPQMPYADSYGHLARYGRTPAPSVVPGDGPATLYLSHGMVMSHGPVATPHAAPQYVHPSQWYAQPSLMGGAAPAGAAPGMVPAYYPYPPGGGPGTVPGGLRGYGAPVGGGIPVTGGPPGAYVVMAPLLGTQPMSSNTPASGRNPNPRGNSGSPGTVAAAEKPPSAESAPAVTPGSPAGGRGVGGAAPQHPLSPASGRSSRAPSVGPGPRSGGAPSRSSSGRAGRGSAGRGAPNGSSASSSSSLSAASPAAGESPPAAPHGRPSSASGRRGSGRSGGGGSLGRRRGGGFQAAS